MVNLRGEQLKKTKENDKISNNSMSVEKYFLFLKKKIN